MWVVDQKGRNTFDIDKVVYYSLEDMTEGMVKYHPAYNGKVSVITLHYSAENPDIKKAVACFADEKTAKECYKQFVEAMAKGYDVFDFSSVYSEKDHEIMQEIQEEEKIPGQW